MWDSCTIVLVIHFFFSWLKLPDPAIISELEQKLGEAHTEASKLKEKLSLAEEELEANKMHLSRAQSDLKSLQDAELEQKEGNTRLREKLSRLEVKSHSHKHC